MGDHDSSSREGSHACYYSYDPIYDATESGGRKDDKDLPGANHRSLPLLFASINFPIRERTDWCMAVKLNNLHFTSGFGLDPVHVPFSLCLDGNHFHRNNQCLIISRVAILLKSCTLNDGFSLHHLSWQMTVKSLPVCWHMTTSQSYEATTGIEWFLS